MRLLVFACLMPVCVAVGLAAAPPASADPWAAIKGNDRVPKSRFDSTEAKARKEYETRLQVAQREYSLKLLDARKKLVEELDTLTTEATKAGDLERAVALRDAKQAAEDLPVTPDGAPLKWRPGAIVFDGIQYRVFLGKLRWAEAQKQCKKLGGRLAVLDTPEKRAFIGNEINGIVAQVGAYHDGRRWVWLNGKPVGRDAWAPGRPSKYGPCGHLFSSGKLGDGTDGEPHPDVRAYVCEWPTH